MFDSKKVRRWSVGSFFGLLLLLGFRIVGDYGVSWDEPTDHLNGLVNIKYIASLLDSARVAREPTAHLIPSIVGYRDNDHGVAFELPVTLLSYVFTPHNPRRYFYMRHLLIFGVFVLGVGGVYQLGRSRGSWRLGLLAALLLVLSPRIFANAFYNGKDLVFMSLFALNMALLVRLAARPTWARAAGWGLVLGLVIDVRVLGLLLLPFAIGYALLTQLGRPVGSPAGTNQQLWTRLGGGVLLALVVTVAAWPYLWEAPVARFISSFSQLSRYPWPFTNLYLGQSYKAADVPWHYVPVWMVVTTPVAYVVAAAVGLGAVAGRWLRALSRRLWPLDLGARLDLLLLGWLIGPIIIVVVLSASLYDAWRHMYFVYPALVLLAARGVQVVWHWSRQPGRPRPLALAGLVAFGLATGHTAWRMVRMHPLQNMYFSFLSAPAAERLFERDYWGLSFRQGLEWLVVHQPTGPLRINVPFPFYQPLYNNGLLLPEAQRQRIQYVPLAEAEYFIGAYRWHPQPYPDSLGSEIYALRVEGIKTLSIFRKPAAEAVSR